MSDSNAYWTFSFPINCSSEAPNEQLYVSENVMEREEQWFEIKIWKLRKQWNEPYRSLSKFHVHYADYLATG